MIDNTVSGSGWYYIVTSNNTLRIGYYDKKLNKWVNIDDDIIDVLSPIPAYITSELNRLTTENAILKEFLQKCYSFIDIKKPNVVKLLEEFEEVLK